MPGNPLVRFDEGRVGRTPVSPSLLLYREIVLPPSKDPCRATKALVPLPATAGHRETPRCEESLHTPLAAAARA
jgi:hypothetical protein